MEKIKVSFPHMGNYFSALKCIGDLLSDEVIMAPPITKKTIEIGFKHSPETVCIPFKYNLGNYIEALDRGANVLIQAGGGCRFGHYGELQEEILRNLGYKFTFIKLVNSYSVLGFAKDFRKINPKAPLYKIIIRTVLAIYKVRCLDIVEDYLRKNIGFEKNNGEFERALKLFLRELERHNGFVKIYQLKKKTLKDMSAIPIDKPAKPLRVGVVGELYILMEPFSNFYLEKELAKKGIEVHRFVTISSILREVFSGNAYLREHLKSARPYLKYHLGAHGTESVSRAKELIESGYDGIIHLKPFGCMPEVSAMSALNRISKDYEFPIIYFSFDSQTSLAGVKTRLEAFYDMLMMKKAKSFNF